MCVRALERAAGGDVAPMFCRSLFPSHKGAPRVVVTNGMVVWNYSSRAEYVRTVEPVCEYVLYAGCCCALAM
jgi:hypothetical protein